MKRAGIGVLALCLGLTAAACGGGNEGDEAAIAERTPEVGRDGDDDGPRLISTTGCVTASGDQFVLTDLEPGAAGERVREEQGGDPMAHPQPTTESYQLIGNEDELRSLVGRQVRVFGSADPPKVAQVREMTPTTEPGSAAGTSGTADQAPPKEPEVGSVTQARLEVTQLRVQSMSPTGGECPTQTEDQPR